MRASEFLFEAVSIDTKRRGKKFSTQMMLDGIPIGSYEYDANSGRSLAEVDPKYQGQGYGKLLIMHAIYTATILGIPFYEDESRTQAYDAVLDSLWSDGYIVDDNDMWFATEDGTEYLKSKLKNIA